MKNYIEIVESTGVPTEIEDYLIVFYHKRMINDVKTEDIVNYIENVEDEYCLDYVGLKPAIPIDGLVYAIEKEIGVLEEIGERVNIYGYEGVEEYIQYLDLHETFEILQLFGLMESYLTRLGYSIGIVGYSNWAGYIGVGQKNKGLYEDIWEGRNFYDIKLVDENNETKEIVDCVYAPTEKEIRYNIDENILIENEECRVIKNDHTMWLDFPLVERIEKTVKYEFVEVE